MLLLFQRKRVTVLSTICCKFNTIYHYRKPNFDIFCNFVAKIIYSTDMTNDDAKRLVGDPDGLLTYEYLANNIENCDEDIEWLVDNVVRVDLSGQFTASAARYLHAIDPDKYGDAVNALVAATIGKDREHRYLQALLAGIYGNDYQAKAAELSLTDDNFRRIYKRLYPANDSF